jgi:hypothetical protein
MRDAAALHADLLKPPRKRGAPSHKLSRSANLPRCASRSPEEAAVLEELVGTVRCGQCAGHTSHFGTSCCD